MTSAQAAPAAETLTTSMREALDFNAPYVIEKLFKNRIADDIDEAALLFREAKRYLVLAQADQTTIWPMFSVRVDEAWHQFVLYTTQYAYFCQRFFGKFVHHAPSNALSVESQTRASSSVPPSATFSDFRARYARIFGCEVPAVWSDWSTITLERRVVNDASGALAVREANEMVELVAANGAVGFRASAFAQEALSFIAGTGAFYVRELPGALTDEERVALTSELVLAHLLRVCA